MALRIRKSGTIICAAMSEPKPNDTYINDYLHYEMSEVQKVIVSEPMPKHKETGLWWWAGNVPAAVVIEKETTNDRT